MLLHALQAINSVPIAAEVYLLTGMLKVDTGLVCATVKTCQVPLAAN